MADQKLSQSIDVVRGRSAKKAPNFENPHARLLLTNPRLEDYSTRGVYGMLGYGSKHNDASAKNFQKLGYDEDNASTTLPLLAKISTM